MTINARSEMDLEEDTIKDKVAKASGGWVGVFGRELTQDWYSGTSEKWTSLIYSEQVSIISRFSFVRSVL